MSFNRVDCATLFTLSKIWRVSATIAMTLWMQELAMLLCGQMTAKLLPTQVIAMRLYTGPMFCLYNASLRKAPADVYEALKGNRSNSRPLAPSLCSASRDLLSEEKRVGPASLNPYRRSFWKLSFSLALLLSWYLANSHLFPL
jgi:hypothetical protein